jgi:hypothetical protein
MTSITTPITTAARSDSTSGRPPAPAVAAGLLSIVLGLVGGYGAIYFTGLEGWDAAGITFVTTYEAISIFAIVSAIALLAGNSHGRVGLVAYGVFMIGFTVMKLVVVQEWEATTFGVLGAVVLVLALRPRTRAFTDGA